MYANDSDSLFIERVKAHPSSLERVHQHKQNKQLIKQSFNEVPFYKEI